MNARRVDLWLFLFLALVLLANLALAGWFFIDDYRRMQQHCDCKPYIADSSETQRFMCPDGSLVERPW